MGSGGGGGGGAGGIGGDGFDGGAEFGTELANLKKKRIMRWDPKKRNFVKQSIDEISKLKGLKRDRSTSSSSSAARAPVGINVVVVVLGKWIVDCIL